VSFALWALAGSAYVAVGLIAGVIAARIMARERSMPVDELDYLMGGLIVVAWPLYASLGVLMILGWLVARRKTP